MLFSEKSPFYVLRHKNFRLLWLGLLISRIGSEMQVVAINWQTYLLTHSAFSLGLIGLSRFLPIAVFSLPGGVAADKFNRIKVMFIAQILMTLATLVLVITTYNNQTTPLTIYLVLAATSIATAFDTPARQSTLPLIVPKTEFVKSVSLTTILWQSAIVVGPAIGGFVIAYYGLTSIYLLNALSFITVIIALILMDPIKQQFSTTTSFNLSSVKEGLSYVRRSPLILSTMLLDFFATFFASASTLMPIYAKDILRVGPQGLGFLYTAPAIGSILTGLITTSRDTIKNQGKLLIFSVCLFGASMVLFGISHLFYLSLIFLFLSGCGDGFSTIVRNTIRHTITPDYIRGRMVSINQIFFIGGPQLGEVEAGFVAGLLGVPFSVISGGIAAIIASISVAYIVPQLWRFQGHEHLEIV